MNAIDTDDVNDNGLDLDQDTFNGFVVGLQVIVDCLNHSWNLFVRLTLRLTQFYWWFGIAYLSNQNHLSSM